MSFGGNMFEHVKNGLNASICLQKPPIGPSKDYSIS